MASPDIPYVVHVVSQFMHTLVHLYCESLVLHTSVPYMVQNDRSKHIVVNYHFVRFSYLMYLFLVTNY